MEYITQQITQNDVVLTWDQIYEAIDTILLEDRLKRRHFKLPKKDEARKKETIEVLPNGARRIKMNWNLED